MNKPIIGVLALQGAVTPHKDHIEAAGGVYKPVKTPEQFDQADAFILPGGESTTMLKLIERFDLWDVLNAQFAKKPVWGICAGAILMAQNVQSPAQQSFGLLPMTIERNGYGRQLQSHHHEINGYPVSFIRAPIIKKCDTLEILSMHNETPAWVKNGPYMATTFHPELTLNVPSPMHKAFVYLVKSAEEDSNYVLTSICNPNNWECIILPLTILLIFHWLVDDKDIMLWSRFSSFEIKAIRV